MSWDFEAEGFLVPVVVYERAYRDCKKIRSQSCQDPGSNPVACHRLSWVLDGRELPERFLLPNLRQLVDPREWIHDCRVEQCGNLQRRGYGPLHEATTDTQGAGTSDLDGARASRRAGSVDCFAASRRAALDRNDKKIDSRFYCLWVDPGVEAGRARQLDKISVSDVCPEFFLICRFIYCGLF